MGGTRPLVEAADVSGESGQVGDVVCGRVPSGASERKACGAG